jgi:glycosyltransferase involved in cell wall biosynthesis
MCAYNPVAEWFDEAVNSVFNQSYKNFELLIVDDGSDEEHTKFIQKYVEHSNVQIIRLPKNMGLAIAGNIAIRHAKGKYLIRLDADDILINIEPLVAYLETHHEAGLVQGDSILIDWKGGDAQYRRCEHPTLELMKDHNCFMQGATMFRTDLARKVDGYFEDITYAQDYGLWGKLMKISQCGVVHTPIYKWRRSTKQISHLKQNEQNKAFQELRRRLFG